MLSSDGQVHHPIFLWITFGYLAALLNCDLQRFLTRHPIYTVGYQQYVLFVLMTKYKWYFVVPVICLLLVDQGLKKSVAIHEAAGLKVDDEKKRQECLTMHYMYLQHIEYRDQFSLRKFFFTITMEKC